MYERLPSIIAPVLALALVTFLIFRLRLFSAKNVGGKYAFLFGGICVLFASVWQTVKTVPDYDRWFLPSAYPVLDIAQFALFAVGLILLTIGLALYADYWQSRRENIETREEKLSILENLHHDARQPYQLLELINISLREILCQLPGCAGAVFLLNRGRRQFILAASSGLSKKETALLEHYPLERNIISQSVELGDPVIGGGFELIHQNDQQSRPRFDSCLVLPLLSGVEKIGGILLLSEEHQFFGRAEIKYLTPVAEWLAEKIRSARLARELSVSRSETERYSSELASLFTRLSSASKALSSPDAVDGFCRALAGVSESDTVHLLGLKEGGLQVLGGSEPLLGLTENYRTALVEAIGREKPLIVNQEAASETGRSEVVLSSLVFPLGGRGSRNTLLLRRESSVFTIDDRQLKALDIFGHLAHMALWQSDNQRLSITRRKGFQAILQLLRSDTRPAGFEDDPGYFMRQLDTILPENGVAVMFSRDEEGALRVADSLRVDKSLLSDFFVLPGEGNLGRVVTRRQPQFVYGRSSVTESLETYEQHNRAGFQRLFGEDGVPSFLAFCPIVCMERVLAVAGVIIFDLEEGERGEWERLLTLAAGLYSLRLTMMQLHIQSASAESMDSGPAVNELNNHLSSFIGTAELAARSPEISVDVREQLREIVTEAESAAAYVRKSLAGLSAYRSKGAAPASPSNDLNEIIKAVMTDTHVSGDLYMAGGRPHEINLALQPIIELDLPGDEIKRLFEGVINRFGSIAEDEDVVSVCTYRRGDYVYLDVSRHHRNFPSVEPVAGFGQYEMTDEALRSRPADVFLRHVADSQCHYAVDRMSANPAYLSFKFPVKRMVGTATTSQQTSGQSVRLLAIDDHAVILDLISAMGQSLGYQVDTASRGKDGIRLAEENAYDIILTDLAMPDISGLEVARRIRVRDMQTPIILVTGWEANLEREQLRAVGIHEVLYKPFRIEQLTDIVKAAVGNRV